MKQYNYTHTPTFAVKTQKSPNISCFFRRIAVQYPYILVDEGQVRIWLQKHGEQQVMTAAPPSIAAGHKLRAHFLRAAAFLCRSAGGAGNIGKEKQSMSKKVAIIMGSKSDLPVVSGAIEALKSLEIPCEVHVMSAHRTPEAACAFARNARNQGFGAIIAAAGKAAHLAGVLAAHTTLPVIGIPVKSSTLDGLDALLATVQMPKGVPVATVAIDGAANAAYLAAQMLGITDEAVAARLEDMKKRMTEEVLEADRQLQAELA